MNLTQYEKNMKKVRITNIYHGRSKSADPKQPLVIYASLEVADTKGLLLISATLDYILEACKNRNYIIVK